MFSEHVLGCCKTLYFSNFRSRNGRILRVYDQNHPIFHHRRVPVGADLFSPVSMRGVLCRNIHKQRKTERTREQEQKRWRTKVSELSKGEESTQSILLDHYKLVLLFQQKGWLFARMRRALICLGIVSWCWGWVKKWYDGRVRRKNVLMGTLKSEDREWRVYVSLTGKVGTLATVVGFLWTTRLPANTVAVIVQKLPNGAHGRRKESQTILTRMNGGQTRCGTFHGGRRSDGLHFPWPWWEYEVPPPYHKSPTTVVPSSYPHLISTL